MAEPTREQLRSKRHREVRAKSLSNHATKAEHRRAARLAARYDAHRVLPLTRGECERGPRPCPCVSCVHNLYLDVSPRTGCIKLNFPDLEPWDMPPDRSCVLDVVEEYPGGTTLEETGALLNVTRERARQLQASAMRELRPFLEGSEESGGVG